MNHTQKQQLEYALGCARGAALAALPPSATAILSIPPGELIRRIHATAGKVPPASRQDFENFIRRTLVNDARQAAGGVEGLAALGFSFKSISHAVSHAVSQVVKPVAQIIAPTVVAPTLFVKSAAPALVQAAKFAVATNPLVAQAKNPAQTVGAAKTAAVLVADLNPVAAPQVHYQKTAVEVQRYPKEVATVVASTAGGPPAVAAAVASALASVKQKQNVAAAAQVVQQAQAQQAQAIVDATNAQTVAIQQAAAAAKPAGVFAKARAVAKKHPVATGIGFFSLLALI
jgi:hypothetical protein